MLTVPTIAEAWSKVRKSYDPDDIGDFKQRAEAKRLAVDLGFATNNPADTAISQNHTSADDTDEDEDGWYCFSCPASDIVQPDSR